jgi:hypothetical protein
MMERREYEFVLRAVEPIAHASESFGNSSIFMRRRQRQADGSFLEIPIITADTMRHGMREAATYVLLDAAGMLERGELTEAALRLLFAGGMVTGNGDAATVRLDQYREMVELLPHMALFGGCAGNRVIPGRLTVSDATLICDETIHLLPGWVGDWLASEKVTTATHRSHVEEVQRVRMDPSLTPEKRHLLSDGARAVTEQRLLASEAAGESADAAGVERSKSSMMPRRMETLVAGSLLFWRVGANCYSPLDVDTFHTAIAAFLASARVGGKRGTGHGLVVPVTARSIGVASPSRNLTALVDPSKPGVDVGAIFRAHVAERSNRVAAFLAKVDA